MFHCTSKCKTEDTLLVGVVGAVVELCYVASTECLESHSKVMELLNSHRFLIVRLILHWHRVALSGAYPPYG